MTKQYENFILLDGHVLTKKIFYNLKLKIEKSFIGKGRRPGLAVILVGDDSSSVTYVKLKKKRCNKVGIRSFDYNFSKDVKEFKILETIDFLNNNNEIDAILCQLPLPTHINEQNIINAIAPEKDVDCFHPINIGKMILAQSTHLPCTPAGILELLDYYKIDTAGKNITVIGRSNIVGTPLVILFAQKKYGNATVTLCHSNTRGLREHTKNADIIVSAAAQRSLIKADMVKDGVVIIDVSMNSYLDGNVRKLVGDVEFDNIKNKCSAITPVPGGVGPMTIAMLLKNCYKLYLDHDY